MSILWHKPILKVLLSKLQLPDIIRLSVLCKKLYKEWVPFVEQVVNMPYIISTCYWQSECNSISQLRNSVKLCYQRYPLPGIFICVRCQFKEIMQRMINLKLSKHTMCYMCYMNCKERKYITYKYAIMFCTGSKRLFDKWFDKVSIPIFEENGNDYCKESYWVVEKDLVLQTYPKRITKKRKK